MLASDWYADRLQAKIDLDRAQLTKRIAYLEAHADQVTDLGLTKDLEAAKATLAELEADPAAEKQKLVGTLGLDPMLPLG